MTQMRNDTPKKCRGKYIVLTPTDPDSLRHEIWGTEERLYRKLAWYPVKLSSGKWVFCEYYWVLYEVGLRLGTDGLGRGSYLMGKLDSEEAMMLRLSR